MWIDPPIGTQALEVFLEIIQDHFEVFITERRLEWVASPEIFTQLLTNGRRNKLDKGADGGEVPEPLDDGVQVDRITTVPHDLNGFELVVGVNSEELAYFPKFLLRMLAEVLQR